MLSRIEIESFPSLSYRARLAYSLSCIERLATKLDLHGSGFDEWLERAWRRTSSPSDDWRTDGWPRNLAEIDALFDPPAFGWEGIGDTLRKTFELAKECCESILERTDRSSGTEQLRGLVVELTKNGAQPPDPATYARSASSEMAGWGRSVPPGFFRDGIEREAFASHLVASLRSTSRTRRREAAHAAGHMGMGSDEVETALANALTDTDAEVVRLAEGSLRRIGRTDLTIHLEHEREIQSESERARSTEEEDEERVLRALSSEEPKVRETAALDARWIRNERICQALRGVVRNDTVRAVREQAALSLAEILENRFGAEVVLRDPQEEVKVAAARVLARDAAHAFETAPALFRALSEVELGSRMAIAIFDAFASAQPSKKADLVALAVENDATLRAFLHLVPRQFHKRFFDLALGNAEKLHRDAVDTEQQRRALLCLEKLAQHASQGR